MSLRIGTFSFFQDKIGPIRDCVQRHPTAAKIARFAAGAFGTGLLLSLPFTSYYWAGKIATAAVAGVSLAVSLFVSAVLQKTPSVAQEVRPPAAASPAHPRRAPSELWSALQAKTERPPNGRTIGTCRHPEIPVFTQEGAYHNLHARDVGKTSSSTFIASQTPMPDEIPRFWETICDQRVHLIVDLNLGREEEIMYYPNDDQVSQFGPFSLWKREGQSMTFPGYSVFNIRDFQRESFHGEVNHIRFPHKNLRVFSQLVDFVHHTAQHFSSPPFSIWVHCDDGAGRTGVFIAAMLLKDAIQQGKITQENVEDKLIDLIVDLRRKRGPDFVRTQSDFEALLACAYNMTTSRQA